VPQRRGRATATGALLLGLGDAFARGDPDRSDGIANVDELAALGTSNGAVKYIAAVEGVVAIVGILAGLAGVSLSDVVGNARRTADAEAIDDLLRSARNLARQERRCVQVVLTSRRVTATPIDHGRDVPPLDCSGGRLQSDRAQQQALPSGVTLTGPSFIFDRNGGALAIDGASADGAIDFVVTITGAGRAARTIRVRVLAGSGAVVRRA
jgi:type II secretory pathway pseudopilin PulG